MKRFIAIILAGLLFSAQGASGAAPSPAMPFSQYIAQVVGGNGNFFVKSKNASILPSNYQVLQEGLPPKTDADTWSIDYILGPNTGVTGQNMDKAVTYSQTQTPVWQELIMGGCIQVSAGCYDQASPSAVPYANCRLGSSSVTTANASMYAEWAYGSGQASHNSGMGYLDFTEAAGLPDSSVYTNTAFVAAQTALCDPVITASFNGTTMTVTAMCGGSCPAINMLAIGDVISGSGVPVNDNIVTLISATGTTGTYQMSATTGIISAEVVHKTFGGYKVAPRDTTVLPPGREFDLPCKPGCAKGVLFIYEPNDDRTCPQTTAFFTQERAITNAAVSLSGNPSYKMMALFNRTDEPHKQGFHSGMCPVQDGTASNSDTVLGLLDYYIVGLDEGNNNAVTTLQAQLATFATVVPTKMLIRIALTRNTADIAALYTFITTGIYGAFYGIWIWPRGITEGGWCNLTVNRSLGAASGITTC